LRPGRVQPDLARAQLGDPVHRLRGHAGVRALEHPRRGLRPAALPPAQAGLRSLAGRGLAAGGRHLARHLRAGVALGGGARGLGGRARAAARAARAAGRGRRVTRPPAKLRLNKVSRWYGDVLALDGIDLELGPGVTGLLGPNGAGKSTLIRLVVGLASPGAGTETQAGVKLTGAASTASSGTVTLDGQIIRNNIEALARIGYVPDGDGLYEEQTARRFLVDQARLRGFLPAEGARRAEEMLVRVGLADAADRRAGGFSKGMRQRLKLAQAMLHDPDVLVLDEPLTGLDPVMRRDYIRIVRALGDEGVTVLVSSHVLHEIEAMTDGI